MSSYDSYRPSSSSSSRRPSENMGPPPHITRITQSEGLTSKPTSPPTNNDSQHRQKSTVQAEAPLLDSLNGFAQSIMSAASLTVKRDLLKQQAVGQQREQDRQSKFKSIFLTLVEDAEARYQGIEKASLDIDKQFNLNLQTQSKNATTLATRLLKNTEVPNTLPRAYDAARLKDDVADIKADLETTKREIDKTRDRGRLKDDIADLKADLESARKRIDNLDREAVMSDELRHKLRALATKDELRGLAAKDEVREMITKDDPRRVTTDEVRKHITEALIPMEEKLASLTLEDAMLSKKSEDAEVFIKNYHDTAEDNQNASKADREKVELIRTDLDSLINGENQKDASVAQGFEEISVELKKQQDDLARLQTEFGLVKQSQASRIISNHPPTPPFANASISPHGSDQQRLQDVETALRYLTRENERLNLFVGSQQQKFEGLTSDHLVQCMVHQMQRMYPQHPGNLIALQTKVDGYFNRLTNMESQILAQINSRISTDATNANIQETMKSVAQYTTDTRTSCSNALAKMKKEIESLKAAAANNQPQGPSEYANRIDKLMDRIATVEDKYVSAIAKLEKIQTDLVRDVTLSQQRSRIGVTENASREPSAVSRSSKSVEPTEGTTISRKNTNDGDSDTPLRDLRDREDRRPSESNVKRKSAESNGEDEDEGGKSGSTNVKKGLKRRNVSGKIPFS